MFFQQKHTNTQRIFGMNSSHLSEVHKYSKLARALQLPIHAVYQYNIRIDNRGLPGMVEMPRRTASICYDDNLSPYLVYRAQRKAVYKYHVEHTAHCHCTFGTLPQYTQETMTCELKCVVIHARLLMCVEHEFYYPCRLLGVALKPLSEITCDHHG